MDEKIKWLRSLPIEEFGKLFNEMYDAASDDEKEEIICSFRRNTHEHIKKVDTFIEETMLMMRHDETLEYQLV